MNISHWLYPVQVLGPGKRLVLWTQGCSRACPGCVSPEFAGPGGRHISTRDLARSLNRILDTHKLDGVTISGGEPMEQGEALLALCSLLHTQDILIYSGWSWKEIRQKYGQALLLSPVGVVISGPYQEALNDDQPLRGSSNQELHYLKPGLQPLYEAYLAREQRQQELFISDGCIYAAGIPGKGHASDIRRTVEQYFREVTP